MEEVKEKCSSCKERDSKESHDCPYKTEIHDSYAQCNCCDECRYDCLMSC